MRFVQHVGCLKNLSSLRFTKYNQYESLILPIVHYLTEHGVDFSYDTTATNILVNRKGQDKVATKIEFTKADKQEEIFLTPDDLVFVTNGSITESTTYGDNDHPAPIKHTLGASWELWQKLAAQDDSFGHPEVSCQNIPDANWTISATITFKDKRIAPYIEAVNHKDPYSGSIVTSGPTSIKDSSWLLGYSISRQPDFKAQKDNKLVVWFYPLYTDRKGNYIDK